MIVAIALAGMLISGSLISVGLAATHHRMLRDSAAALPAILASQALAYLVVLWFMRHLVVDRYHRNFDDAVRWHWPGGNWYSYIAAGVLLAVAVQLTSSLLPIPRTLPIDRYFQNRGSAWLMSIFGVTMAPLVEELFFRGFLYPVLARRMGMTVGVLLTAIAFAFMHASQLASAWAPLLMLFLVGLVLTLVRVWTRSVARGFLIHAGYNLTLFTLLFLATDHFRHMEKLLQQ